MTPSDSLHYVPTSFQVSSSFSRSIKKSISVGTITRLTYFLLSGLEADQRVLAAHGCYALTATTGLTAQNTLGVQDIHVIPAGFLRKQINAALEDIGADVVKLGASLHSNPHSITHIFYFVRQACYRLQRMSESLRMHCVLITSQLLCWILYFLPRRYWGLLCQV